MLKYHDINLLGFKIVHVFYYYRKIPPSVSNKFFYWVTKKIHEYLWAFTSVPLGCLPHALLRKYISKIGYRSTFVNTSRKTGKRSNLCSWTYIMKLRKLIERCETFFPSSYIRRVVKGNVKSITIVCVGHGG